MTMQNNFFDALTKLTFLKLGRQIRINRKYRGMTVSQLAGRIKVTPKKLRTIERGHIGDLKIRVLVRIAHAFDCGLEFKLTSVLDQIKELNKEPEIVSTFTEETS